MSDWPLIGRAEELTRLRGLLMGSEPRSVVLAGPSGVGKSRLAQECLEAAETAGLTTLQVVATRSAAQLPFGAVAPVLHSALAEPGSVDDRTDLLRRSVAALAEPSEGRRLLLLVEDAHLLDDASATLIHQIAVAGAATVLATLAAGEPAPDPVVALWKDGLAERVDVEGLGRDAVESLLGEVLGGPVDPATAIDLAERSQGNVLFLRELVIGAMDDGSLQQDGGMWRLTRQLSPSDRLVEIVHTRLGQLNEDERALMELVAYGEPLGQAELADLFDPALAEAMERRSLLTGRVEGRRLQVHLAHPIYGDVIRASTPALRARKVVRQLAETVEKTSCGRHDDLLRVAAWRYQAGEGDPATLLEGAVIARWRYDFSLAEDLARAAAEAGAGFDAELLAALVAGRRGRRNEAETELAALAEAATNDDRRARVAIVRFDNLVVQGTSRSFDLLSQAREAVTDPDWRDRLEGRQLILRLAALGPQASVDAARPLLERAEGEALMLASLASAWGFSRLGKIEFALDLVEQARVARQGVDDPLAWYPWWPTVTRCETLFDAGHFRQAEEILDAHHNQALAEGSSEAQAVFAGLAARGTADRGRVRSAARRAQEALAVNQRLGRAAFVGRDLTALALALSLAGSGKAAQAELDAIDNLDMPLTPRDEIDVAHARAWATAATGDLPAAQTLLGTAADAAAAVGDRVGEAAALHAQARMGRARNVKDRLDDVCAQVEGPLAAARMAHTAALVRGDAAALAEVSETFETLGADLLAAEASADTAVARRRAGEMREATVAERRAGILVDRCEDPVTPALQTIELRVRLTASEREAAVLAAGGRSNKDIAAQLFLSSRTIENRLQKVYEKLGVSGRAELAEALSLDE